MKLTQEELVLIFSGLKEILQPYETYFTKKFDLDSKYDLWSIKDLVIEGRKREEVYFVGIIIQSTYVGFYFMPVYVENELSSVFSEKLLSLKKGKSCFHIKYLDDELKTDIVQAVKVGFSLYQERGWV